MAIVVRSYSVVYKEFFRNIFEQIKDCNSHRKCPALPDSTWIEIGVRRCLKFFQSGRDFLQNLAEAHDIEVGISTFFESLKSSRRSSLVSELNDRIRKQIRAQSPDPFQQFSCLDGFDIYAGDGHSIAAAVHDPRYPRKAKKTDPPSERQITTKYATGHLYTIDLRSQAMSHLTVADQITRKKEHEMRALKRLTINTLRQNAPTGRKVLYIWDRAGIDFRQWYYWKHQNAVYFVSREKENMDLYVLGENPWERDAHLNHGVLADQIMGNSCGVSVRRVIYRDPETKREYRYLTNLPTSIPPGIIALLYKARWDIEKVFDEFKNKLQEKKSWASSSTAKTIQAQLLCLTWNLLILMEEKTRRQTGAENIAEQKRRQEHLVRSQKEASLPHGHPVLLIRRATRRFTQHSVKFIRWLNNHLDRACDWHQAGRALKARYAYQ